MAELKTCAWCGHKLDIGDDGDSFVKLSPDTFLHNNNDRPPCVQRYQESLAQQVGGGVS